ncbi:hypothetical protein [Streptomyces sp. NPDC046942]|uniref:hypothetical protein n=1 Tax=Streptomyces sp. NPDC046942 TaxID=3155137 RepID=UPI0033EB9694
MADRLACGLAPLQALDGLDYEPDPPIFTPRLIVIADNCKGRQACFGAARRSTANRTATNGSPCTSAVWRPAREC